MKPWKALSLFFLSISLISCGGSSDKTLTAELILPPEVSPFSEKSLELSLLDEVGITTRWGPGELEFKEGLYQTSLGKIQKGNYVAHVVVSSGFEEPVIVGSTKTLGSLALEGKSFIPVATASKLILVTGSETIHLTLNPSDFSLDLDPDLDGVPNLQEIQLGLSPFLFDTDGDGIMDSNDAFPLDLSEFGDTDGDGIGDSGDNCNAVVNPDQADFDQDGDGDACDDDDDNDNLTDAQEGVIGTNPLNPDHDSDQVLDWVDNCPLTANPQQDDTDNDALGNACDPDDDNDGVPDSSDNCPLAPNPDQIDTDKNGQGNACQGDKDGDGVSDNLDNCPLVVNPDQNNTDGADDGGDECDSDDDNDGLSDLEEETLGSDHRETNPLLADSDGDGFDDQDDNCPLTPNPPLIPGTTQTDTDGDGDGDACDCDDQDAAIAIRNAIFVSPSGNDAQSGAINKPVKTLTKALALAKANNSHVYVTEGSYEEEVHLLSGVNLRGGFQVKAGTCERDPNTYQTTILSSTLNTVIGEDLAQETLLTGFTLENDSEVPGSAVVRVSSKAPQKAPLLRVEANKIFGMNQAVDSSYGLVIDKASAVILNNVIFGGESFRSTAVQLSDSEASQLYHNTIRAGIAGASSEPVALESNGSTLTLINNILITDLADEFQVLVLIHDQTLSPAAVIQGNLLLGTKDVGKSLVATPKLLWFKNKAKAEAIISTIDAFNAFGNAGKDTIFQNISSSLKPSELFSDYELHDYRLSKDSPAVDAGVDLVTINLDLEGNSRPKGEGYDVGAYEKQ